MLLFIVFLLGLPATDTCVLPTRCMPSSTGRVPCCPSWNGSPCGYSSGRGYCVAATSSRTVSDPDVDLDDRDNIVSFYYSTKCQCIGNYSGVDCGECIFNHYGEKCDNLRILIRYEARQLTRKAFTYYKVQLNYCKKKIDPDYVIVSSGDRFRRGSYRFLSVSYHDVWCSSHYYATKPFLQNGVERYRINYAHQSSAFLPWHRYFLYMLEYQMQRCLKDYTFTIVYYDWRSDSGCSMCTDDYLGSNNARGIISPNSIFSTWRTVCGNHDYDRTYCLMSDSVCERTKIRRQAGYVPGVSKPNKANIDYCQNLKAMDTSPYTPASNNSFRNCLEGWVDRNNRPALTNHNHLHVYLGGTMSQVPIACNDPMFSFHHAFIDKCWDRWFDKWYPKNTTYPNNLIYPNNPIYGHQRTDCVRPFFQCWTMTQMTVPGWYYGTYYSSYNDPV